MRKVVLRINELFKFKLIKKFIDSNGNKKNTTLKLNCTTRIINYWLREIDILSPKAKRKTIRHLSIKLKNRKKSLIE